MVLTRDELVPGNVFIRASAQEDIGLVEEKHGVPHAAELQGMLQAAFDNRRVGAQFAGAHGVEGHAGALRHRLGRKRFANAGRAEHEYDQAAALVVDEVVEATAQQRLALHESPGQVLFASGEDKLVKGFVVPDDVFQLVDLNLTPLLRLEIEGLQPGRRHQALPVGQGREVFGALRWSPGAGKGREVLSALAGKGWEVLEGLGRSPGVRFSVVKLVTIAGNWEVGARTGRRRCPGTGSPKVVEYRSVAGHRHLLDWAGLSAPFVGITNSPTVSAARSIESYQRRLHDVATPVVGIGIHADPARNRLDPSLLIKQHLVALAKHEVVSTEPLELATATDKGSPGRLLIGEERDGKQGQVRDAPLPLEMQDLDRGTGVAGAFAVPIDVLEVDSPVGEWHAVLFVTEDPAHGVDAQELGDYQGLRREDLPYVVV